MSISEAARVLEVSRPTIYRMIRDGELTAHRDPVLKRPVVLVPREQVEAILRKREIAQPH